MVFHSNLLLIGKAVSIPPNVDTASIFYRGVHRKEREELVKDINGMLINPGNRVYVDKIGKSANAVRDAVVPIRDKGYQVNLIDSSDLYDGRLDTCANIQIDDVNYTLPSIIEYIEKQAE